MKTRESFPEGSATQQHGPTSRAGHRRRSFWLIAACGSALVVVTALLVFSRNVAMAPAAPAPAALAIAQVSMRTLQFYPPSLEVNKGGVVEWKNDDLIPHTATSPSFDSGS